MKLPIKLERPLVMFDIEATGPDPKESRITEIGMTRFNPDGTSETFGSLVNPGVKIPDDVVELTGITNDEVSRAPRFSNLADRITNLVEGADLAGYNAIKFDAPILKQEYVRAGVEVPFRTGYLVLDILNILRQLEIRTQEWAYEYYLGEEPSMTAHRAADDVEMCTAIFRAQSKKYGLKNLTVDEVVAQLQRPYLDRMRKLIIHDGEVFFDFGKYGVNGKQPTPIKYIKRSYFQWLHKEFSDLDDDAWAIIEAVMKDEYKMPVDADG